MQNEQELLDKLRAGDESAFLQVVNTYHGQLLRLARLFVSSDAIAQEVVQETWLAVIKGIDKFEERSSLKTWIFRILSNRAKTRGVREARSKPFSSLESEDSCQPAVDPERFNQKGFWLHPPTR